MTETERPDPLVCLVLKLKPLCKSRKSKPEDGGSPLG